MTFSLNYSNTFLSLFLGCAIELAALGKDGLINLPPAKPLFFPPPTQNCSSITYRFYFNVSLSIMFSLRAMHQMSNCSDVTLLVLLGSPVSCLLCALVFLLCRLTGSLRVTEFPLQLKYMYMPVLSQVAPSDQ